MNAFKDTKLLSYDACRMAFFPRKDGAQGTHGNPDDLMDRNDHLSLNSATIKIRQVALIHRPHQVACFLEPQR